jgi:hypothetical protein
MVPVQGIFRLPSSSTTLNMNSTTGQQRTTTSTSSPVTLTFSNLTLVNLPPGPPSTYPLGMSTIMMWSIDMDR